MPKNIVIVAFYHFVPLPDFKEMRQELLDFCVSHEIKGTILLAEEGINATVSGTREGINVLLEKLCGDERFAALEWKESYTHNHPFKRMKVRLKKEIIRMGFENFNPKESGIYIKPKDWDNLLKDPAVMLIDTRNHYEIAEGAFENAVNPGTRHFGQFPAWAKAHIKPETQTKVAMYCTGGIRCEKASALVKQLGIKEVYHLKGGILQYLEDTKNANGKWQGKCFVFDERETV